MGKKDPFAGVSEEMRNHIRNLGLPDKSAYKAWCRKNGFSSSFSKGFQALRREKALVRAKDADSLLKKRKRPRNALTTLREILTGKKGVTGYPSGQQYWAQIMQYQKEGAPRIFFELLEHILNYKIWKEKISFNGESFDIVAGIYRLCQYRKHWVRSFKDWDPRTHNPRRQFASLARHLFAKYSIPSFLDCVWFNDTAYIPWFWHVGQGGNIRTLNTPVPVTKKIAHHFLQAPDGYSIVNALRFGQIHSLQGDQRLVEAINQTNLGESFLHEDFWSSVIKFFVQHTMLDRNQVGPVIDYLQNQKFAQQEVWVDRGRRELQPPPQPNLSMKNRDPGVLLRRVEEWHNRLNRVKVRGSGNRQWEKTGIKPLHFETGHDKNLKIWTIEELLTEKELAVEGRKMNHCVASYAHSCVQRRSSIWSMSLETFQGIQPQLTIEVNQWKTIVQARGKRNIPPTTQQKNIMKRWADQVGLSISKWVR